MRRHADAVRTTLPIDDDVLGGGSAQIAAADGRSLGRSHRDVTDAHLLALAEAR